jgi:hypothetical protein
MPQFVQQLALVSDTSSVSFGEVALVAAALDKQATRDFAPIWDITASIHAFESLEEVPLGYWPMIIRDDIGFDGAAGIHLDKDGQPFALITGGDGWALTASHEAMEMLADPFGNRVIAGPSIMKGQGRVNYLVEVCDPSEAAEFGYTVNDILLSDFYTPAFFDPDTVSNTSKTTKASTACGVRYSFTGAITKPRDVLRGGYLSWNEPVANVWWQATFFGAKLAFRNLGPIDGSKGSIRSQIDAISGKDSIKFMQPKKNATLTAAVKKGNMGSNSSAARAKLIRAQIDVLKKAVKK